MSTLDETPSIFPLTVGSLTLVDWDGFSYVDAAGRTYWSGAGKPDEVDANLVLAAPRAAPVPALFDSCAIGTRIGLTGEFLHSAVSTLPGRTLLGIMPWGWAPANFGCRIGTAFDAGSWLNVGTASSPARYVSALPISTVGFMQRTPLELKPLSAPTGTPIFIQKNAPTTTGDIIKATLLIERVFLP